MLAIGTKKQTAISPRRMFLLILVIVFLAEALVMLLLPSVLPVAMNEQMIALLDSCLLTLITAPILWWVVVEPLRKLEREKVRLESLKTIAQFATSVAHEVRNPLTSIKILIQSHQKQKHEPEYKEDLNIIESEIRRMESTLISFIEFARPHPLKCSPFDLRSIIDETLLLINRRASKQQINIKFSIAVEKIIIDADEEQLRQVLLNLCLNALDFMPQGGNLSIEIDMNQKSVIIAVLDSGPGIEQENLDRVFEPFFTTRETGVGLGLAVCRRIIIEHGGEISAETREHGGSCFRFSIPR